jgi:hypothetical protein
MAPLMSVGLTSRANWKRSRLYKLARRTLVASIVSLLISFANVLVVVITHGHERGLVCLTMCTLDVTVKLFFILFVCFEKKILINDSSSSLYRSMLL